jgi:hypothetical protein
MSMTNVLCAGLLAGLLVLFWRAHSRRRIRRAEKGWKPESLKTAVLAYAERTFFSAPVKPARSRWCKSTTLKE